jgi:peptidoglycan-N-acetylglucosamine deacetylase
MIANLSIDLDNKWAYLKTAKKPEWESYPSYLPEVCPRIVSKLASHGLRSTIFVVGRDLLCESDARHIANLSHAGHRLANHSWEHDPWLHLLSPPQVSRELLDTHTRITDCCGKPPIGFRGPGYSDSPEVHRVLKELGYRYVASSFPSCVGPMARAYYLLRTGLKKDRDRAALFGSWWNMFRSNRPYAMQGQSNGLWMFPVTVQPVSRLPFHFTYLFFLTQRSPGLARLYFRTSLRLCRLLGVMPSLLLHPLDFLGMDEHPDLAFFPGMRIDHQAKLKQLDWFLGYLVRNFQMMTMEEHLDHLQGVDIPTSPASSQSELVHSVTERSRP